MNLENIKLIKKYDYKLSNIDEKLNYYNNMIHEYKYNLPLFVWYIGILLYWYIVILF